MNLKHYKNDFSKVETIEKGKLIRAKIIMDSCAFDIPAGYILKLAFS